VKINLRRAVAASTVCATALVGTLTMVSDTAAGSESAPAALAMSNFGYNTSASGTVVRSNNVEVRTGRTAFVSQSCTRLTGQSKTAKTAAATPDNPYINISAVTTSSTTYRNAAKTKYGVRAVSTIGDVAIGDPSQFGQVVVKGLQVYADSFHTPKGYGNQAGITFGTLKIVPPDGVDIPQPLQDLLDAIETQVVGQIVGVLQKYGTIDIPGFGTIGIGERFRRSGAHYAAAWTHGLVIRFTGDGTKSQVLLGQAHTRIGGPTPLGTFRSDLQAMDVTALDGAIHLSRVGAASLPCEGTRGNTEHFKLASAAAVPVAQLIALQGIDNAYGGNQLPARHLMKSWVNAHLDKATIKGVPGVSPELVFTNINAKVTVQRRTGHPVATGIATSVGGFTIDGVSHTLPKPGSVLTIKNGAGQAAGTVETRIVERGRLGAHLRALRVTLFEKNIVIYLGWAFNSVWDN